MGLFQIDDSALFYYYNYSILLINIQFSGVNLTYDIVSFFYSQGLQTCAKPKN